MARSDVPSIPVERVVLEDDEAGRLAVQNELAFELLIEDARDATVLRNGDLELGSRENKVVTDRAGCRISVR